MKYLLLAVGAFCLVATYAIAQPNPAPAGKVKLEMFVLHASTQGQGFDKRLPPSMTKRLKQPPYSAYTRYMMLSRRQEALAFKSPLTIKLPDRSVLRLSASPSAGKRFAFTAEIKRKAGKFLPVLKTRRGAGKFFIISGHKHNKGTLFVGVHVKAQ